LNSTNRWPARPFKALCAALTGCVALNALLLASALPARAQSTKSLWFVGTNLILAKEQIRNGEIAVASDDPGLARFLVKLGATLSYEPGQRYIVVTSADRRTIAFTLGDTHFTNGSSTESAPFAPYAAGGSAYVPFMALARALYVLPLDEPSAIVLQPQLGALDVRTQNGQTFVALRGAIPVKFARLSPPDDERVQIALSGVATALDAQRSLGAGPLRGVTLELSGSPRNPTTTVTFDATPGTVHALAPSHSPNELVVVFGPRSAALGQPIPAAGDASAGGYTTAGGTAGGYGPASHQAQPPQRVTAQAPPSSSEYAPLPVGQSAPGGQPGTAGQPEPPPPPQFQQPGAPLAAPVQVTSFDSQPSDQAFSVRVGVTGPVAFEWHRLPDNRWYIDLKGATLAIPARDDQPHTSAVASLRLKQLSTDPDAVVRIALSLNSPRQVDIVPSPGGFTIAVSALDDLEPQKVGVGRVSAGAVLASAPGPSSAPLPVSSDLWSSAAPRQTQPQAQLPVPGSNHAYVATNQRLIVLDPGHGGSDAGAEHNGLVEKDLNLDVAKRLRVLLIARGWQVRMTRDTDVDVYQPNDSARDELQARCDVANNVGARMFVSIHTNSFTSSALNGTTTYYFKSSDMPLAAAIRHRLANDLSTADRGIKKENFYVIHHTDMPATLVEMAFLSNPQDAALLRSSLFLQKIALAIADGIGDFASNAPQVSATPDDGS
jgi:N-acetylmuramoyl-L-alanine amidase CwlD